MRGIHKQRARLADGTVREYHYTRRGGPCFWRSDGLIAAGSPEYLDAYSRIANGRSATEQADFRAYLDGIVSSARKRAGRRRMAFALSTDTVLDMVRRQDGRCAVTGIPFDLKPENAAAWLPRAPSIDRVDHRQGYNLFNTRIVILAANVALGQWGESFFLAMCEAVVENRTEMEPV